MQPTRVAQVSVYAYRYRYWASIELVSTRYLPGIGITLSESAVECLLIVYLLTAKVNCQFGGLFCVWASGSLAIQNISVW